MIDASSKFQSSLPVSSDCLIQKFRELGIAFEIFEHKAVKTVAEAKSVEKLFLSSKVFYSFMTAAEVEGNHNVEVEVFSASLNIFSLCFHY